MICWDMFRDAFAFGCGMSHCSKGHVGCLYGTRRCSLQAVLRCVFHLNLSSLAAMYICQAAAMSSSQGQLRVLGRAVSDHSLWASDI